MRTNSLVLGLSVFSIVVTCLESFELSDFLADSVVNDDDRNQLDSELFASDACIAQPSRGQARARRDKSRVCPPRKKISPTTNNPPKTGSSVGDQTVNRMPSKPFPIPVVGSEGLDWDLCRKASLGMMRLAVCESGDPDDVKKSNLSGGGWVFYRVENAFLRKSSRKPFHLPVHFIFHYSPKHEIDRGETLIQPHSPKDHDSGYLQTSSTLLLCLL